MLETTESTRRAPAATSAVREDAEILRSVQDAPFLMRIRTYIGLTGPGWLQSALTLGGGSLTSSLYLGVLAGFSMLWLQPLAMIVGIIMLSALGYVTLSTGERPLVAINRHINPVLGWAWAAASLISSMVWALPQFAIANAVTQQNLLPGILGSGFTPGSTTTTTIVVILTLVVTAIVTWNYGGTSRAVRIYEAVVKVMVAVIVLAFFGVFFRLLLAPGGIELGAVLKGFLPDPRLIFRPAAGYAPLLAELPAGVREYWENIIVTRQQQVMAAAFATAVGINMTFLFGYSLLRRKWGPEFRGFLKFDLAVGMFIPFVMAVSCIIVASATQFHTVPQPGFLEAAATAPQAAQVNEYRQLLSGRIAFETGEDLSALSTEELDARIAQLGVADRRMAAVLVTRDAFDLARSLEPVTGNLFSWVIFGVGVLGMALSTITMLMLVSGMVVCEALNKPLGGWTFRLGSLLAGVGALGPFFWSKASFWLAIPTSVIGLMLIPIAYVTFFLMMNRRSLLGGELPVGRSRLGWNVLMIASLVIVISASVYMMWRQLGVWAFVLLGGFLLAVAIGEVVRKKPVHAGS